MSQVTTLRKSAREDGQHEMLYHYLTPLRKYLRLEGLTELAINRPGELWIETQKGWERHDEPDLTFNVCMQLGRLIANFNGKGLSADTPILSAGLLYGERVQVIIPPACEDETVSITIRKPSVIEKTLVELEAEGAFARAVAVTDRLADFEHELMELKQSGRIREFLELAVMKRRNILICGATGSGKTTVTRSLIRSIPHGERLVTIEDVHELFLSEHKNKVHLFYSRDDEGGFKVNAKSALISCLRMKPDRILLAELRGEEAWEFVKSINTGHPGSISTMHANGAFEAFEQLTALIKDSKTGAHLDTTYIRRRLLGTIDVTLYYERRQLLEIYYDPVLRRQQMA